MPFVVKKKKDKKKQKIKDKEIGSGEMEKLPWNDKG